MSEDDALRTELSAEYHAIVRIVSEFDGRMMLVKGWSVTLSLAGLGFGFSDQHYALFALAALTGLGFWSMDAITKRHQLRYYARMRDIEVALAHITGRVVNNRDVYSPAIDWAWSFGGGQDHRVRRPEPRDAENVRRLLARAPWMPHVALPHCVAFVLGVLLFIGAAAGLPGLDDLPL